MNFIKKHGIWVRFLSVTIAIALVVVGIPMLKNATTVKADGVALPNLVQNGSFENGLNSWAQNWADFTSVKASDEGLTAPDGEKILKIAKQTQWAWRDQVVTVEPNTDYEYSFWVYRPDSASNSVYKLGAGGNDTLYNPGGSQTYLNNEAVGKWTMKQVRFNSGTNTSVKLAFCAYAGTAYIDNIRLVPVVNHINNGSFENGVNGWSIHKATDFTSVKASDEGLTAIDGTNVLKGYTAATDWSFINQTVTVKPNTKYRFTISYNILNGGRLFYKGGTSSAENKFFEQSTITTATNGWKTVTKTFTTGASDTTFKFAMQLRKSNTAATYIDNIVLSEVRTVSATAQEGGSVSGLPASVYSGDTVNLTATADEGYEFNGWYAGDTKVSDSAAYSFIVYKNVALTAKFKAKDFELIKNGDFETGDFTGWNAHANFSVIESGASGAPAAHGGNKLVKVASTADWNTLKQGVTVDKNSQYEISFWYYKTDDNNIIAMKVGYPGKDDGFVGVKWLNNWLASNKWVKVSFKFNSGENTTCNLFLLSQKTGVAYVDDVSIKKIVNVTTTAENGTISGVPTTVYQGDKLTVTAVPNAGYAFDGWYKNGVRVANTASYSFFAAADTAIEAKFVSTNNLITNGSFEMGDFTGWNAHSDFTVINGSADDAPAAKDGSKLAKVTGTGDWHGLTQDITVEKNCNYRLSFWYYKTDNNNIIALKAGIPSDDDCMISVKWLNNWLASNEWVNVEFKFNSGNNTTCRLSFLSQGTGKAYIDDAQVIKYYNINATAQNGGKIEGLSQNWADVDTPVSLTATAEAGFAFEGWYENDVKISSEATLQFNATADRNIVAKFAPLDNYTVDGGFEQSALVSAWQHSDAANSRLSISAADQFVGNQSAFFASKSGWAWSRYKFNVKKNTDYMVNVMIKVPEGDYTDPLFKVLSTSDLNTNLIDGADPSNGNFFCRDNNAEIKAGNGWQKGTFTFNSGNNDSLYLLMTGNGKANCYIDELVIGEAYVATVVAGENGKVASESVKGLKNTTGAIKAVPDKGYMVEGWYIRGQKVSEEKVYNHLFTENVTVEVKFTRSTLPIMTAFDHSKLWCAAADNLIEDSGFQNGTGAWNTASFIKNGILDVVDVDGDKVLYFNPDGTGRQIVYFPVELKGDTEYMFSAEVKGKYFSDTNKMDMNFGIMTKDSEFITMENANMGGYRDERPNITFTKSITPPSWDNNWHRRGIVFKTNAPATVWIAIAGNLSEAYLDDFILCEYNKARNKPIEEKLAKVTSYSVATDKMSCADSDNLVENYNFAAGSAGWEDGYGWNGLYSGVYIGDSGNGNKSLFMRSTTGYADRHYYIQWIDVKPNTDYTLSLAAAATSLEANYGILVEGKERYNKLAIWSVEGNREWVYNATTFNSNDSTRVGIYVMDGGRVTALDDVRLFETAKATALTDKLTGKADLPEEYIPPVEDTDDENEGEDTSSENTSDEEKDDKEEETTKKKTKKKKVVKVIKNNNGDADYTLWWILGGIGAAVVLVGIAFLVIILLKRKHKKAV